MIEKEAIIQKNDKKIIKKVMKIMTKYHYIC
mgnify:CR=1 FL=1